MALNIVLILERIKDRQKCKTETELGRVLGVPPQNVNGWRNRNTIPWPELYGYSTKYGVSMDWILTGQEPPRHPLTEGWSKEVLADCVLVNEIYESGSHYKQALKSNIHSFHQGVSEMKKAELREDAIRAMRKEIERLTSATEMAHYKTEALAEKMIVELEKRPIDTVDNTENHENPFELIK